MMEAGNVCEGDAAKEDHVMLRAEHYTPPTETDREIFQVLVPPNHYLRRAAQTIDFERFRPLMEPCYSLDQGRPAIEPVLLLKLEFLQYHDRLSDQRVIDAAQVNVAYREFLGLGLSSPLPNPNHHPADFFSGLLVSPERKIGGYERRSPPTSSQEPRSLPGLAGQGTRLLRNVLRGCVLAINLSLHRDKPGGGVHGWSRCFCSLQSFAPSTQGRWGRFAVWACYQVRTTARAAALA
jgi:hypothetical protein